MTSFLRRLTQLCFGLVLLGIGVAATIRARLGAGPWDVLHQGLARAFDAPVGLVTIGVGLVAFAAWVPLRQRPGIGTPINVVLVGVVVDTTLRALEPVASARARVALLVLGLLLIAFGSALYLSACLGTGPRDGVLQALHRRFGWSPPVLRTSVEVGAVAFGVLLGGRPGPGTVLVALAIGPLVHTTLSFLRFDARRTEILGDRPVDAIGVTGK